MPKKKRKQRKLKKIKRVAKKNLQKIKHPNKQSQVNLYVLGKMKNQ